MARIKVTLGKEFVLDLCKRLHLDSSLTKRIVIDIPTDGIAMVYVQQMMSSDVLDIVWPESGFTIEEKGE